LTDLFSNLGRTLALLRDLRGLSQAALARKAGIGKSQLSKYETGKEKPKLESLSKLLAVLEIQPLQFFFALELVGRCSSMVAPGQPAPQDSPSLGWLLRPLDDPEDAFAGVFRELLRLHRHAFEQSLFGTPGNPNHSPP
jgi:transcriptional regulator with XRE-family HTH domain